MARSESLSSTRSTVAGEELLILPEPSSRHAGAARFLLDGGNLLCLTVDVPLDALELGEVLLPVLFERRLLVGIVAIDDLSGQGVDAALQRVEKHLAAIDRVLGRVIAVLP